MNPMNTSIISHRMFVAALGHNENAAAQQTRPDGRNESASRGNSRERQVKELTPHQLMLALMSDGFEPWNL